MRVLFLVVFILGSGTADAQSCNLPTVGPNDPHLPKALPGTFQVTIAATIENSGYELPRSLVAKEYMNTAAGRSAFYINILDVQETVIVNTKTNESYHIEGSKCTVENAKTDYQDVFNGGYTGSKERVHAYSAAAMLRFAQQLGEIYIGQTTIRGIPVDHWRTCMQWKSFNASFTLDYYFSTKNWTTNSGVKQLPVRAEVNGTTFKNGTTYLFHHIYDYINFQTFIDDSTKLEIPKGTVCQGRKHIRSIPKLADNFRFKAEVKSISKKVTTTVEVWYDFDFNIVRFDYRPTNITYPTYSNDPVTEIHDFSTGVAYVIDKLRRNCTMMPIENNTQDAITASGFSEQLKTPKQLFLIDSRYSYSGQRLVRGMLCDVYGRINPYNITKGKVNAVFEIYFLAKSWTAYDDVGSYNVNDDVPVRMEITIPTLATDVIIDFYDFDQEATLFNSFDISPCYTDTHTINYEIKFPARFRHWINKEADFKDNAVVHYTDPIICASICLLQMNKTCNSFDICPKAGTCSLSLNYTSDGKILKTSKSCDHYSRVAIGRVVIQTAVQVAYNRLKTAISQKQFNVVFKNPDTKATMTFQASSVRTMPYIPGKGQTVPTLTQPSSNNQTGAIVGAAIGMLVLGVLIGVGAVILFNRRSGQGPDVKVSYSNDNYKG